LTVRLLLAHLAKAPFGWNSILHRPTDKQAGDGHNGLRPATNLLPGLFGFGQPVQGLIRQRLERFRRDAAHAGLVAHLLHFLLPEAALPGGRVVLRLLWLLPVRSGRDPVDPLVLGLAGAVRVRLPSRDREAGRQVSRDGLVAI